MNDLQVNKAIKIASLIIKQGQSPLSSPEKEELEQWLREEKDHALLLDELTNEPSLAKAMEELNIYDQEAAWRRLSARLDHHHQTPVWANQRTNHRLWRFMAGVALVLAAGSILIYILRH